MSRSMDHTDLFLSQREGVAIPKANIRFTMWRGLHLKELKKCVFVRITGHISVVFMNQHGGTRSILQLVRGSDVIKMTVGKKNIIQGRSRAFDRIDQRIGIGTGVYNGGMGTASQ